MWRQLWSFHIWTALVLSFTLIIYVINQTLILFSVINLNVFLPTTYYYDEPPPPPPPPPQRDIAQLDCLQKWPDKCFRDFFIRGEGNSSALESFHMGLKLSKPRVKNRCFCNSSYRERVFFVVMLWQLPYANLYLSHVLVGTYIHVSSAKSNKHVKLTI